MSALLLAACTLVSDDEVEAKLGAEAGVLGDESSDSDSDADSDTDADADTDTDTDITPTIESIAPDWGTTLGGTEVILRGTFGEDATVRVGGVDSTLVSVDSTSHKLVFLTPTNTAAGGATVELKSNQQTAFLPDGFTYYLDGTGKVGLIGTVSWMDQVGTYWSGTPTDLGYAYVYPVEPADFDWALVYSGSLDTCVSDQGAYAYEPNLFTYDIGTGSSATLSSAGYHIELPWDSTFEYFYAAELTDTEIVPGRTYELSELALTNDPFPEYTAADVLTIPEAFTVSTPAIGGSNPPQVSSGFSLAWSGGSVADGVIVTLNVWNSTGNGYQETVNCHIRDDGGFNIPSSVWETGWPTNRQLDIFVARYTVNAGIIPYNNASTAVMGEYMLYGAAFTK